MLLSTQHSLPNPACEHQQLQDPMPPRRRAYQHLPPLGHRRRNKDNLAPGSSRNLIALALGRTVNHRSETLCSARARGSSEMPSGSASVAEGQLPSRFLPVTRRQRKRLPVLLGQAPMERGLGWESAPAPGCWGLETAWLSSHAVNLGIRRVLVIIDCNNERVSLDQISGI